MSTPLDLPGLPGDEGDEILNGMLARLREQIEALEDERAEILKVLVPRDQRIENLRKTETAILKALGATSPAKPARVRDRSGQTAAQRISTEKVDVARAWVAKQGGQPFYRRDLEKGCRFPTKTAQTAVAVLREFGEIRLVGAERPNGQSMGRGFYLYKAVPNRTEGEGE